MIRGESHEPIIVGGHFGPLRERGRENLTHIKLQFMWRAVCDRAGVTLLSVPDVHTLWSDNRVEHGGVRHPLDALLVARTGPAGEPDLRRAPTDSDGEVISRFRHNRSNQPLEEGIIIPPPVFLAGDFEEEPSFSAETIHLPVVSEELPRSLSAPAAMFAVLAYRAALQRHLDEQSSG